MKTLFPSDTLAFRGLSPDLRLLTQHVSSAPNVSPEVRRRAQVLLLLDDGLPLPEVAETAGYDVQRIQELARLHAREGWRATLLGKPVAQTVPERELLAA